MKKRVNNSQPGAYRKNARRQRRHTARSTGRNRPSGNREKKRSSYPGLKKDDTIFTTSARTRDFTGQGFIPRFLHLRKTDTFEGNDEVDDPFDRELRVRKFFPKLVYGVRPNLTLAAVVPYVDKSLRRNTADGRASLDSSGIGDARIMTKWRFFTQAPPAEYTALSTIAGVKLPTGEDDETDEGTELPIPLQPGTGSVDGILGMVFNRTWDGGRWLVNADVTYKFNGEANDFRMGNKLNLNTGIQYRILPYEYESYDDFTLNSVLEINAEWNEKHERNGNDVEDSGGNQIFLSPGLQAIVTENLLFETGVQVPVYRDLNSGLGEDYRFVFGMRILF